MKAILTFLLLVTSTAFALESIPARWHQGLSSTYLTDYRQGEHLIISDVWTGRLSGDAVIKHRLEVRVSAWDKPFSSTYESPDKRQKEVLTVTLHETADPKEMRAEFDHVISEDGAVTLRFSGLTVLSRPNSPPRPNNALQRTEAGVGAFSAIHVLRRQPPSLSFSRQAQQQAL